MWQCERAISIKVNIICKNTIKQKLIYGKFLKAKEKTQEINDEAGSEVFEMRQRACLFGLSNYSQHAKLFNS